VQLLRGWKTAPPFTDAAAKKLKIAVKYVEQARRKADKRLGNADNDVERLHRARKAESGCATRPSSLSRPTNG
jgi:hypothetical protein